MITCLSCFYSRYVSVLLSWTSYICIRLDEIVQYGLQKDGSWAIPKKVSGLSLCPWWHLTCLLSDPDLYRMWISLDHRDHKGCAYLTMPLHPTQASACIDNVGLLPAILERCRPKSKLKQTASSTISSDTFFGWLCGWLGFLTLVALQGVRRCARYHPSFTRFANRTPTQRT